VAGAAKAALLLRDWLDCACLCQRVLPKFASALHSPPPALSKRKCLLLRAAAQSTLRAWAAYLRQQQQLRRRADYRLRRVLASHLRSCMQVALRFWHRWAIHRCVGRWVGLSVCRFSDKGR
jgi:hypothetical protein